MNKQIPAIAGVTAVAFDIGGTLLDHAGTTRDELQTVLGSHLSSPDEIGRFGEIITSRIDDQMDRIAAGEKPFMIETEIRRTVIEQALVEYSMTPTAAQIEQLASVGERFVAYPDVQRQLARLAESVAVVGLTNTGYAQMVRACMSQQIRWTALLSTQLANTYKPAPEAYALIPDLLGLRPEETLFVAAHPWDLRGAHSSGFRTVYLPRPDAGIPQSDDTFDLVIESLDELAELLERR